MAAAEPTNLEEKIAKALGPLHAVRVAYLFGSRARGTARADSDLDLALSFDRSCPAHRRGHVQLDAVAALSVALGALGERADLLDLGRASSTIAFRVISEGRCVLARDPRERVRLEATIARRYDDDRSHRELFRRAAVAAAARMGGPQRG